MPTSDKRHGHAGDDGGVEAAQKKKDDQHDQADGQHQFEFHVIDGGFNCGRQVGERGDLNGGGEIGLELRQQRLDALDYADGVGAGLALDVQNDGGGLVHPRRLLVIFYVVDDFGDVGKHDGRAVAVGDHHVAIVGAADQLIVGIDLVVLARAVEVALGGIHAGLDQRGAQVFEIDAVRGERVRIGADAHGRLLAAADAHQSDAIQLRNLWRQAGIDQIFDLG